MGVFADYAIKYFDLGVSVIPINGKRPLIKEWATYSDRLPTSEEIEDWIYKFPDANIGLVCGKASDIDVVDFDYTGPDVDMIEDLVKQIIPPSPLLKKGAKGWSAFYRYSSVGSFFVQRGEHRLIDFLSTGKQTVVPPSYHNEAKKNYVWITPDTLFDIKIRDLPRLPTYFKEKIMQLSDLDVRGKDSVFGQRTGRHDIVCKYGWGIIENQNSMDEFIDKLIEYDKLKHSDDPYFSDQHYFRGKSQRDAAREVALKIEKTVKTSKAKNGVEWKIGYDGLVPINRTTNATIEDAINNSSGFYDNSYSEKTKEIKSIPEYTDMANYLYEFNVLKCSDNGNYVYRDFFWNYLGNIELDNLILTLTKNQCKPGHFENFKKIVKAKCAFDLSNSGVDAVVGFLNLQNGILDIKNKKILSHSSDMPFKQILNIKYNETADCPEFKKFLDFVFQGDSELISLVQEMFGYTLIGGDPFLHKAFVLYGSGRNGKSTLLAVLMSLLGEKSFSTVSMSLISKPFSAVNLVGKLANIVEETPDGEINSEIFKTAVGGGRMQVSHKAKDEFSTKINARFIFACNDMPIFRDKNVSMLDRLVFIPFDVYIEEKDRDTKILERLFCELEGVLNWALVGADRMLKNRALTLPKKSVESKEIYKLETDSVYAWCNEKVTFDNDNYKNNAVTSSEIYLKYEQWCGAYGLIPVGMQKFSKRLSKIVKQKLIFSDCPKPLRIAGKVVKGYDNINIMQ